MGQVGRVLPLPASSLQSELLAPKPSLPRPFPPAHRPSTPAHLQASPLPLPPGHRGVKSVCAGGAGDTVRQQQQQEPPFIERLPPARYRAKDSTLVSLLINPGIEQLGNLAKVTQVLNVFLLSQQTWLLGKQL